MPLITKAYLGSTKLFREKSWFEDMSQKPVNESGAVTVTASSTAHVKGSWAPLVASTAGNATFLIVEVSNVQTSNTDTATLLDIGTGASGAETVFAGLGDIAVGGAQAASATGFSLLFQVPIKIASGTRLSARIQSVVPSGKTATVSIWTFDMGDFAYAPTAVDVIGTSDATSVGTAMTGASGDWVPIISSTLNAYKAVVLVPSTSASSISTIDVKYTVGKGAAGSEVEIGNATVSYGNSERVTSISRWGQLICGAVPSGTRLSVRHDIAATPGNYDMTLIGIR